MNTILLHKICRIDLKIGFTKIVKQKANKP